MRMLRVLAATAALAALSACSDLSRSRALGDPRVSGQVLAEQVCSNCHGARGQAPSDNFPVLAAQQADYLDGELRSLRGQHRRDPAGYAYMWGITRQLTDAQIAQLAAYYAAQPAPPAAPVRLDDAGTGRRLFTDGDPAHGVPACASCHGDAAEGRGVIPRLARQHRAYLLRQLAILRKSADQRPLGEVMNAVAHGLTDSDMKAVAAYLSGL